MSRNPCLVKLMLMVVPTMYGKTDQAQKAMYTQLQKTGLELLTNFMISSKMSSEEKVHNMSHNYYDTYSHCTFNIPLSFSFGKSSNSVSNVNGLSATG